MASIDNQNVKCSKSRVKIISAEFGQCPLRKWNNTAEVLPPHRRIHEEVTVHTIRRLDVFPPDQRNLIEARKQACEDCPQSKRVSDLTVYCRVCHCKGLSFLNGQCKLRKWPSMEEVHTKNKKRSTPTSPTPRSKPLKSSDQFLERSDRKHLSSLELQNESPLLNALGKPMLLKDIYYDQSVFLIAGGPSFGEIDQSQLSQPGIMTMGLNNSVKTFRPNLWVCVDQPSHFIRSIWLDPTIMKFTPIANSNKRIFHSDNWQHMQTTVRETPGTIFYARNEKFVAKEWLSQKTFNWGSSERFGGGRSVMLVALRLLHYLGFRRVYLLGVDFHMSEETTYHFDQKRKPDSVRGNTNTYQKLMGWFEELLPYFEADNFEVYNCNPKSNLKVFDFVPYPQAIKDVLEDWGNIDLESERTSDLYDEKKPNR